MFWASRKHLHNLVRSSLWVVPALSTVAAFLSLPVLRILDKGLGFQVFGFSADGARALAGIVAAAMLSFVVFFFSVMLLTVQIASSTLSPRIIARPFRSRVLKSSLGLFVFTLIYSMAVLARGTEGEIGQLTTAMVLVLTVISICVFLFVVEHVSKQLRPATVVADVAAEALRVISEVYPKKLESDLEEPSGEFSLEILSGEIRHKGEPGVVQSINIGALINFATGAECTIEVVPQVGDFVNTDDLVFRLYGDGSAIASAELLDNIVLERERTLEQDPAFAFRIIVDVAAKALSPAINDPTTAVIALDQVHNLLREVGRRRLSSGMVHDSTGQLRLIYRTPDWEDFVGLAVTEIRQFGASSIQVTRRMRAMLEDLIPSLPAHRASVLRQELALLTSTISQGFAVPQDRERAEFPDFQGLGGHRKVAQAKHPTDNFRIGTSA